MKQKHIQIRIEQCLALAGASNCVGSHGGFGAMLLDPERNVVLMDGYNGGPRGAGRLCAGEYCERDPLTRDMFEIREGWNHQYKKWGGSSQVQCVRVFLKDVEVHKVQVGWFEGTILPKGHMPQANEKAEAWVQEKIDNHPKVPSGTYWEIGCYHAEMNCILNAAAKGVPCQDMWMIITGEPCTLCAKLIYQVGLKKVICIDNGWRHASGVVFLENLGVNVHKVPHPHAAVPSETKADPGPAPE